MILTWFRGIRTKDELTPERYNGNWDALRSWWDNHDQGQFPFSSISFGMANHSATADYTANKSDMVILADASGGALTVTLPTAVGINGRCYLVKRINAGKNMVKIATTGSQTIDGASFYFLGAQYHSIMVMSDNANWMVLF